MTVRTNVAVVAVLAGHLIGCDQSTDTFGHSYDECLLKNLKEADRATNYTVKESCQRHHERAPAASQELAADATMSRNSDGTATFEFRVSNNRVDKIVTGFAVTVSFYNMKVSSKSWLTQYHWSFRDQISPEDQLTVHGALGGEQLKKTDALAAGVLAAVLVEKDLGFDVDAMKAVVPDFAVKAVVTREMVVHNK